MASIKNTGFWPLVTNRVFDETLNITGKFQNATPADEICSAGFLCVKDTLLDVDGYTGIKSANNWVMKATGADVKNEGTGIYACNTYGVNEIQDPVTGNVYRAGANTLGLPLPAGVLGTFTKIDFAGDKIYRFGIGNLSAELSTKTFFTIASGQLVPADAAPKTAGIPYFQLLNTGTYTEGAQAGTTYVDVLACTSVAST